MRRFAISDIHGCLSAFKALLDLIGLSKTDELFLLGDYVDRGPDVYGLLNYIIELQEQGYSITALKGNHEQMMINAVMQDGDLLQWMANGGRATLESYFPQPEYQSTLKAHILWLSRLPYYTTSPGYYLVHAGFNFRAPKPLEEKETMLWIRNWYNSFTPEILNGNGIIHGHTPIGKDQIIAMLDNWPQLPILNIDAGCAYTSHPDLGHLCAFELGECRLFFVKNE